MLRTYTNNMTRTTELIYPKLSYQIVGLCFKVHNEPGRYCREKQYADLFEKMIRRENFKYKRELMIGDSGNIVDFIVEGKILLELKAKRIITKADYIQTQRYLQETNLILGMIVNFRQKYLVPKRVIKVDNTIISNN